MIILFDKPIYYLLVLIMAKLQQTKSAIIPDKAENINHTNFEAVVYSRKYKLRSYNAKDNGENIESLARTNANNKSKPTNHFSVKLEEQKQDIKCPSCEYIIKPN